MVAEYFMKSATQASPATIILHFVVSAVVLAPFIRKYTPPPVVPRPAPQLFDLLLLNLATAVTYALTYLAVWSDLGAAYTNLLDYGLTPVAGFIFAWKMLGERIRGWRFLVVAFALAGLAMLFLTDSEVTQPRTLGSRWGVLAVIGASTCGAWMYALNKRLVMHGTADWLILAGRMPMTILGCVLILLLEHRLAEPFSLPYLFPFALIFYAVPMYLLLVVFKRVTFDSFSLWLFLVPCVTVITAAVSGYASFSPLRIMGTALVFLPVLADQFYNERNPAKAHES